ncbi:MAG: bifunctional 4-hydroxy-2-oxoglutarate aldolase/2-dehydro-3-deoxy-phosphogluconate aldolase [Acidobacteriota bacterium]|nr:bifunctional 4-hydroxy-2-oxoglutarate aldolase/2-dehydro-3-deoxy-phosphogluconate aldolase [Acidobacteriota bacterium]
MTKQEMLTTIEEIGIIPAVRVSSASDALFASEAVFNSGISVVEITMTTPRAVEVISQLVRASPQAVVGAGTVLDLDTARACLDVGASFLTSTGLDPELVQFARQHDIAMIPGALTPTEVMMAKRAGAAFIKIFPCSSVGGPTYIRALRGPFPDVRLIASGGVTQQTAPLYIRAGADVLGIGRDLLPSEAVHSRNSDWIHELSRRFIGMVKQARNDKLT